MIHIILLMNELHRFLVKNSCPIFNIMKISFSEHFIQLQPSEFG